MVAGIFHGVPLYQFPGEHLCHFLVTSKTICSTRLEIYYILIRNKYKIYKEKLDTSLTPHKSQLTTMLRIQVGTGAKGSAQARSFHPIQNIREKWPNEHRTKRVLEVLFVWKGTHRVNWNDQLCYKCRIPKINGTVFHICWDNFKIEEAPPSTFED